MSIVDRIRCMFSAYRMFDLIEIPKEDDDEKEQVVAALVREAELERRVRMFIGATGQYLSASGVPLSDTLGNRHPRRRRTDR